MGFAIKMAASNRLSLRDAVALSHSYFPMLKAAVEQRLSRVGGAAVMLDSVVEIAAEAGYEGTVDQAASILKVEGGFVVGSDSNGRLILRWPEFPADFPGENSAHGLSGGVYATVMCPERCPHRRRVNRRLLCSAHPIARS